MKTNDVLTMAMQQVAISLNIEVEDFRKKRNIVIKSDDDKSVCKLVSFGNNVVAISNATCYPVVAEYVSKYECYNCFDIPNIHWLDDKLFEYKNKSCFIRNCFLPDVCRGKRSECAYQNKILNFVDLKTYSSDIWKNALCKPRIEYEIVMAAMDESTIVGIASAYRDKEYPNMSQIGIDVCPQFRRRKIATSLTSDLTAKLFENNRIPLYCCSWGNIPSVRNAIHCGFVPTWIEMVIKPSDIVNLLL